ncbi:YhdH/YhfP family quinone oxidoreductase [Kovacikia minuta CCNUW1]|uniref:YhdH/YhfP family quinone oxidoreductase n=1 Tax=Kovacikia minuta TaxID=2931930 RepID=UPI001CCDAFC8|nr:YhdH/YhfP family quinone oxidoreductase [Kovacikia minuta]UBF23925.1 YhdH/YhfP family quinone oxidoreductase [Kovacikia minuta CCNUW1]
MQQSFIPTPETFQALFVEKKDGEVTRQITEQAIAALPLGEVLIQVHYSSLNYKDALAATGHPGVTKKFPHIPGIDAAGTIVNSTVPQFQAGDSAIVTGFDLGMNTWGGFAEYIRVPAAWMIPLPAPMTLWESMALGTSGLTAALCVEAFSHNGVQPDQGEVLVTGATGGVGSLAVSILAKLGFSVVAVTGKPTQQDYLRSLGATAVISREEATDPTRKPLLKERWAGVVDTVGGNILATAIKTTRYGGCVAACGLVGGTDLNTTVYPFILRGVCLNGIDSANCPLPVRKALWKKLATDWKPAHLEAIATTIHLSQLSDQIDLMLQGKNVGRIVVVTR